MTPTMKDLGIDRLSPEQRIALALEIWESLDETRPPTPLNAEQQAELARRDAELDANPGMALTWEQIRASVEKEPLASRYRSRKIGLSAVPHPFDGRLNV